MFYLRPKESIKSQWPIVYISTIPYFYTIFLITILFELRYLYLFMTINNRRCMTLYNFSRLYDYFVIGLLTFLVTFSPSCILVIFSLKTSLNKNKKTNVKYSISVHTSHIHTHTHLYLLIYIHSIYTIKK